MGTLFVLVSPWFRENVVVTCKIGSFLCSLNNLLQKNVIVFLFEIKSQNGAHLKKRAIFDLLFTFFSHQARESYKNSYSIYLTQIHTYMYFAHPIDFFCLTNFEKKIRTYQVWFLFGMSPGVDPYSRHFGTIDK